MKSLTQTLKNIPLLVTMKRTVWNVFNLHQARGKSHLDINTTFPLFQAAGLGVYKTKAIMTTKSINETIPLLQRLSVAFAHQSLPVINLDQWELSTEARTQAERLRELFQKYGSDKASTHNYYLLYGAILANGAKRVLEIGLGTNDSSVVSHMGNTGHPGSSLRAFRDLLPGAIIYGADIDKKVLFSEDRIETFWTDQTEDEAMAKLFSTVPGDMDLIIDDGLHSSAANLRTLFYALPKIKKGGWIVIEDIVAEAIPLWQVVQALLPAEYSGAIYKTKEVMLFAVERKT